MKKTDDFSAQQKRFIETARALECDEDKERFEAKMKRIAKARAPDKKHEPPKS
jgi:hypothetical protein